MVELSIRKDMCFSPRNFEWYLGISLLYRSTTTEAVGIPFTPTTLSLVSVSHNLPLLSRSAPSLSIYIYIFIERIDFDWEKEKWDLLWIAIKITKQLN